MKGYGLMTLTIVLLLSVTFPEPLFCQDSGMDHTDHVGEKIHESVVEGYRFAYHLVDLEQDTVRHLMVYMVGPDGEKVEEAVVGFLVKGPDDSKQKLMAEGMKGAFGTNVGFKTKGAYVIKMKAVTGDKKLFDEFTYVVK